MIYPKNVRAKVAMDFTHHKIASSNTSRLEAHDWLFQIAYEGGFCQKVDFLISNVS